MSLDIFNCPHCDARNKTHEWTENWRWDADEFEIECCECKEYFEVRVSLSVNYELVED